MQKSWVVLCAAFLASMCWATSAKAFLITRVSSPTFYYDAGYNCAYAGYLLDNNDGQAYPDLWASVQSFSGPEIGLADNEDGLVHVGRLAVGEKRVVFFYLKKGSGAQAGTETHEVRVAPLVGANIAQQTFSLSFGAGPSAAGSGNAISAVSASGRPSVGATLQITVTGNTGPVASGATSVVLSPAAAPSWRPDAFELQSVAVTFPSSAEPAKTDLLAFDVTSAAPLDYVATYTFRCVGTSSATTALTPLTYVGAAQSLSHTTVDAGYLASTPLAAAENRTTLSRAPTTAALPAAGGTQAHSIVVSSTAGQATQLDRLEDALTGSGATYVAGSSRLNGASAADPVNLGASLVWTGLPDLAANGSLTLAFEVRYAANSGTVAHGARAGVGPTWLDTTLVTSDAMPAIGTVYVGNAPDQDADGLADLIEAQLGTDPAKADTDGDGLGDGVEVNGTGPLANYAPTDPLDADSDDGGANDGREVLTDSTDPNLRADDHVCNNGIRTAEEACDDGNTDASDGCTTSCALVDGYVCTGNIGQRSACAPNCGDGKVITGKEQCDDQVSLAQDGDGCSATCSIERGYLCEGSPSICRSTCGDGLVAADEECDDGAKNNGDGCTAACKIEAGYACAREPSSCEKTCGDGNISALEQCDDGAYVAGDGCSAHCSIEHGYTCSGAPSACATTCGDGLIAASEGCDDRNTTAGDGCSAQCVVEAGFACEREASVCRPRCGDGQVLAGEECDDNNTSAGDGCSASCKIEDRDMDGVTDQADNCPGKQNRDQADQDGDSVGDVCDEDRDGDGLSDADEQGIYATAPDSRDSDADGLDDGEEVRLATQPNDADSDDDGVLDGAEPNYDVDSDEDGLSNVLDADSDNDGLFDGTELGVVLADLTVATERARGSFVADSDPTTKTDPLRADTDGGGECDGPKALAPACVAGEDQNANGAADESEHNPLDGADDLSGGPDTDGDGLSDQAEARRGTDPRKRDTDADGLSDGQEIALQTDPLSADSDRDGVIDGREVSLGTDPRAAPADEYSLAGGTGFGCSVSARGSAFGAWSMMLGLALWWSRRSWRRTARGLGPQPRSQPRSRAAWFLLLIGLHVSARVAAQTAEGFALNHFDVSERGSDWFAADSLDLRGHMRVAAGVAGEWAYRPLVVVKNRTQQLQSVVRNQFVLHPGVSLVVAERWRFALDLPLQLYSDGRDAALAATTYAAPQHTVSLGDARLGVAVRLFGEYSGIFTAAAGLQLSLPTGDASAYAGDGAVRVLPHVMVAGEADGFVYAAKLGVGVRTAGHAFLDAHLGSYAYFALAAGIRLLDRRLWLGPELFGRTDLTHKQTFDRRTTPSELLLGAHYALASGLRLGLGIGFGLTHGMGAPEHRGLLNIEWQAPSTAHAQAQSMRMRNKL